MVTGAPTAIPTDLGGVVGARGGNLNMLAPYLALLVCGMVLPAGSGREQGKLPWKPPPLMVGYGVVNLWHTIDANRLGMLLERAGCNLTEIEYVAWFNDAARNGLSAETHVDLAARFVTAMRRHHIVTFINVVNWNGVEQRKQDDAWFLARVQEIRDRIGPSQVILQGVSEPDESMDGKAYRWMRLAAREWPGILAANGDAGRGEPRVPGFDLVDWHHCRDLDEKSVLLRVGGRPVINNTDCGPVTNPGPSRASAMARAAVARGAHFLIYGFKDASIDERVIRALGEVLREYRSRMPSSH